jgi:hypothetical protein
MDNPYAAPAAPVLEVAETPLADRSPAEIRALYRRSSNADAILFLVGLGLVLNITVLMRASGGPGVGALVVLVVLVFQIVAMWALIVRHASARIIGLLVSGLFLLVGVLGLPFGILPIVIGVVGVVTFARGRELFGPGRLTRPQIKAAYKAMKAEAKAAKAAAKAAARAGR